MHLDSSRWILFSFNPFNSEVKDKVSFSRFLVRFILIKKMSIPPFLLNSNEASLYLDEEIILGYVYFMVSTYKLYKSFIL